MWRAHLQDLLDEGPQTREAVIALLAETSQQMVG